MHLNAASDLSGVLTVATSTQPPTRSPTFAPTAGPGSVWTSRTSAADNSWLGVTYGNGLFVAVSEGGANRIQTSDDGGVTWLSVSTPINNQWSAVTFGNNTFGTSGTLCLSSFDGLNWTIRNSAADNQWGGVAFGNGLLWLSREAGDSTACKPHLTASPGRAGPAPR